MAALIRTEKLSKFFASQVALEQVDFAVSPGEVHVLAGANGAGKSTLVKILYGALEADAGDVVWKGRALGRFGIARALDLGIAYIAQEVQVAPQLSVAENIFLGNLPPRRTLVPRAASVVNHTALAERAAEAARAVGLDCDVQLPAGRLSIAERQLVAIARALARRAELLLLDEPTASLSPAEITRLFDIVARLKAAGSGVIFISHRMEEIERIGDRLTVLRDGRVVFAGPRAGVSAAEIVGHMTGRRAPAGPVAAGALPTTAGSAPPPNSRRDAPLLRAENIEVPGRVGPLSFAIHAGEILGVAGVVGAGRTSLARALFGSEPEMRGEVFVEGRRVTPRSPAEAIAAGIALLTEDRKDQGLVLTADVATNISLASGRRFLRGVYFDHPRERAAAASYVDKLAIRTPSVTFPVRLLSGGNQQKALLARWLLSGARVFLLDEPTRGIDVEAKRFVYGLVRELAAAGHAVLFISSELPEVLEVAGRILVLHRGGLRGEIPRGQADEHALLLLAMGGKSNDE